MIGFGNSMFLATHGILAKSASGAAVDPDAQAFITAASITDPTQQSAINQLVVDLKGYNIWTKMKALYPFCGSTASQHKWNLKDPRDLDVAYRIFWSGGVTHSANGVQFGGVNGYGDTFLTPFTSLSQNSAHLSFYSRTNNTADAIEMGSFESISGVSVQNQILINFTNQNYDAVNNQPSGVSRTWNTDGMFITTRTASGTYKSFRNSTNIITRANVSQGNPNRKIWIGGRNNDGVYTNRQCAFASIGDGLTDTEAANFYTAVQAFQVSLGRSIGTQTVSDADAQAFVTNAGIVDQVEANAVNNLVIGLKADGLWTKMKAVYPFVGGTATTNSYNLRNTAQYQITWSGGVTHSANGVQFGGVNGFGDTFLNQSSNLSITDNHISVYSRTNSSGNFIDCGLTNNVTFSTSYINCRRAIGNGVFENGTRIAQASVTNSLGYYLGTASATNTKLFKNGSAINTSTATQTGSLFNLNIPLGAVRLTTGQIEGYTNRQLAFASIGDGLTDTEATNLNTRVTTFQTALNRNV